MTTKATATVLGGFWPENGVSSLVSMSGKGFNRRMVAILLERKTLAALRELMETLNGTAAGGAALKTYGRVEANVELGGVRLIETETMVNRVTVAADVTEINEDILSYTTRTHDPTPVVNGNNNPLGSPGLF